MKRLVLTAVVSSLLTLLAVYTLAATGQITSQVKLEKPRVTVTEVTHPVGVPREPYVRPTDQVIVFLDDCAYDRVDAKTGAKTRVARKSGEVIWHDKGEHAPTLINAGSKPYRTLVVALK
jgi:hypothetical protein